MSPVQGSDPDPEPSERSDPDPSKRSDSEPSERSDPEPELTISLDLRHCLEVEGESHAPRLPDLDNLLLWHLSRPIGARRSISFLQSLNDLLSDSLSKGSAPFQTVLRIHEILVRIRIRGTRPLTNGSGSGCCCYFRRWTQQKNVFFWVFLLVTFWRYIYIIFKDKIIKKSQNSRNQRFS